MPRKLLDSQLNEARALLAKGMSLTQTGKIIGVDRGTIKYWLNAEYRESRIQKQVKHDDARAARAKAKGRAINGIGGTVVRSLSRPDPDETARLLALIPADTRSLTGRICGDPLPGRSALCRRQAGAA